MLDELTKNFGKRFENISERGNLYCQVQLKQFKVSAVAFCDCCTTENVYIDLYIIYTSIFVGDSEREENDWTNMKPRERERESVVKKVHRSIVKALN